MMTRASTSTIVSGVVLSIGLAFTSGAFAQAQKKDPSQQVSQKVGTPLTAALTAAKGKQYDVAIAKLKEAEALSGKTAFEQFKISEVYAFIYSSQQKYAELASIQEKQLQTPQFLAPGRAEQLNRELAQTYSKANQNAKAMDFANQWLKTHPNDTEMQFMVGQIHFQNKEFKQCREVMNGVIAQAEKAGTEPKESWLQFSQSCSQALDDNDGVMKTWEKIVRYHPKPEYWSQYLTKMIRQEKSDAALFEWSRLMMDVGVLKDANQCIEYAQMALADYGSGPEAQRVAEYGFSKQVLGTDPKFKTRHDNLLAKARDVSKEAKAKLAQLQTQAEKATTGEFDAQVGMIQFGSDQYDQAIKSFEVAIKKGGLKELSTLKQDTGTVKMTLAIAQLKKGQREQARATFKSMESDPAYAKVAAAWALRSYN